jgi:hypothetical protein
MGLAQRLRARGVRVTEVSFTPVLVGRLAIDLHVLLREHRLALPDDEGLLDELGTVRLRETRPGVFRLDHDSQAATTTGPSRWGWLHWRSWRRPRSGERSSRFPEGRGQQPLWGPPGARNGGACSHLFSGSLQKPRDAASASPVRASLGCQVTVGTRGASDNGEFLTFQTHTRTMS